MGIWQENLPFITGFIFPYFLEVDHTVEISGWAQCAAPSVCPWVCWGDRDHHQKQGGDGAVTTQVRSLALMKIWARLGGILLTWRFGVVCEMPPRFFWATSTLVDQRSSVGGTRGILVRRCSPAPTQTLPWSAQGVPQQFSQKKIK